MRIAILAPLNNPVSEPYAGGVEAHTHSLVKGFQARGHAVTLFAHPGSDEDCPLVPITIAQPASNRSVFRSYRHALRLIARGQFDLLHNNSFYFLPVLLARSFAFPVVTTLHTPPYKFIRWATRLAGRSRNQHFIAISQFVATKWAPYIDSSHVIHNGINLAGFSPEHEVVAKSAIWCGRIHPTKGPHHAALAARAAGFSLDLVGPIVDHDYFEEQIAPLLDESIRYLGHVTQLELAVLMAQASVGVVTPIWEEPFGLICVEMLACGTPVAAFDSGAVAEILTPDCSAIVPQGETGALARVLGEVASKQRSACTSRAAHFSVDKMVDGYLRLYAEILRGKV
ncbi:glycosyltransferase [Neolewinella antarctica]|uniref:Glycosyltransferase involved in cell wall biosynthesis n=1 Tax=Neolewinella antarctica TaxID=442734 RepID=A0ABX0XAL6_9BACT|nr:glycosyltransferase [Neolewinella antarctica]NJC25832.1 glycosyltransferase involved in cell wall biosynthesis [Neolewinella antarctica]